MDRRPSTRAELEDRDKWSHNDLQSLAADLEYGPIVGETRPDLIDHIVDVLEFPSPDDQSTSNQNQGQRQGDQASQSSVPEQQGESASRSGKPERTEQDNQSDSQSQSAPAERETEISDGGTQTTPSTEEIDVGHEGSEKLQPEDAPDPDGTAVAPPEGLENKDIDPDLLEPEASGTSGESASRSGKPERTEPESQSDSQSQSSDEDTSENQSEGGLRQRLGIGNSDETPEEIVEEADDPDERDRREQFRRKLDESMGGADQEDVDDAVEDQEDDSDDPSAGSTTTAQGMVVDEEVVGSLIEMPFNTASAATGWDGWELSEQERRANARLFVAMCDERDIDVSATTMFGLSMASTFGSKAVRYRRYKEGQGDNVDEFDEDQDDSADAGDDVQEARRSRTPTSSENQSENSGEDDFGF